MAGEGAGVPLFELAEAQRGAVVARFEGLATKPEWVDALRAQGRLSVNVRPAQALEWLDRGHRIHAWARAAEAAAVDGRTVLEVLAQQQGSYFDRRVAFEQDWAGGGHFHYAALNGGGAGLQDFGPLCVVLRDDQDPMAFLEGNSLEFFDDFSVASIQPHVAPPDLGTELAVCKLHPCESNWQSALCGPGSYVEALRLEPLRATQIEEVRIDLDVMDALTDAVVDGLAEVDSSYDTVVNVHDYTRLCLALDARGVPLIGVPHASA